MIPVSQQCVSQHPRTHVQRDIPSGIRRKKRKWPDGMQASARRSP
ncbi:hypothetical protein CKO_04937 [Citrobacter koseri ATCC BAA-895]|uniref:Uncharacterized protein n=1 Tax=Citrobacter koseri (strain ATCC BAA-895 / CDC 4225-83 / SGSC4696) TaxID=290338 RepID=A8AR68_CITK8|nr:hypothetical protein CKO_04937 [Citrobacter koseri ATCC BAA-895]